MIIIMIDRYPSYPRYRVSTLELLRRQVRREQAALARRTAVEQHAAERGEVAADDGDDRIHREHAQLAAQDESERVLAMEPRGGVAEEAIRSQSSTGGPSS